MAKGTVFFFFLAFIFGSLALSDLGDDEYEDMFTVVVEHSFDSGVNPVFTRRGVISAQAAKAGPAHFSQDKPLSPEDLTKLRDLVRSNGVYRVRVLSKPSSPQGSSPQYVSGFMTACALYESGLSDQLTLHVNSVGGVFAVCVSTTRPYCQGQGLSNHLPTRFNTTAEVVYTVPGPSPETQSYIEKMERDKSEKAKGQQQDTRSFIAKYWMYIVPVVLIMMFANAGADPNQAGGSR